MRFGQPELFFCKCEIEMDLNEGSGKVMMYLVYVSLYEMVPTLSVSAAAAHNNIIFTR